MKTMMEKNARKTRTKAMIFAVVFHILLIGGITYSSNSETPVLEQIQALFGEDASDNEAIVMEP